jgi:dephospho-CoA kinase
MQAGRPIIGITGGIGSGKSFVASLFGELGCLVIDSDQQVARVYQDPQVRRTLGRWWGDEVLLSGGKINRRLIARHIFNDPDQRRRLEELIHPRVLAMRDQAMSEAAGDERIVAFVWDTPLLYEAGLADQCDAVVFVQSPLEQRLQRVARERGWDRQELDLREKSQWPLDRKRDLADYVIENTTDRGFALGQVKDVLTRILTQSKRRGDLS